MASARFCAWCFFLLLSINSSQCFNFLPNLEEFSKQFPKDLEPILEKIQNRDCRKDVQAFTNGVRNYHQWAIEMLDASGKWNAGFMLGNIKSLGSFEQCVMIKENALQIRGQYCLANLEIVTANKEIDRLLDVATLARRDREITMNRTQMPVPDLLPSMSLIQFGVCVPSSCSAKDVESSFNYLLKTTKGLDATSEIESCFINEPFVPSRPEILFTALLAVVVLVVALSSTAECYYGMEQGKGFLYNSFMAFSLPTNWKKLTTISHSPSALNSLDGIRILSTLWVVAGHKIIFTLQEPWTNKVFQLNSLQNIANMPLVNNMPSVDTFFLMSGLLRAYNLLKEFDGKRFDFFTDVSRRYLRLTPVYALVIAFYATLLPRLGSGPRWQLFVSQPGEACAENWINNVLYINSYAHNNKHCMIQTWYLASDMQLFLVSPLVVYLLWKKPSIGKIILFFLAAIPIAYTAWYTYINNALPTYLLSKSDEKLINYQRNVHITTHHRMAPYIVGLGLGYFMYYCKNVRLSVFTLAAGWGLCFATLYAVIFGAFNLVQFDHKYDALEAALYASLHRVSWAIAVAWLIFACNNGYGGWITKILSLGVFQPLSKISYCIYLSHYAILMIGTARIKSPLFVDEYALIHDFLGDLVMSIGVATILYLAVEAPLFEVTRHIFSTAKHQGGEKKKA